MLGKYTHTKHLIFIFVENTCFVYAYACWESIIIEALYVKVTCIHIILILLVVFITSI